MKGNMGIIYGYTIIEDAGLVERTVTKKQTRKFKNTRWVKKYRKKYSKVSPSEHLMFNPDRKTIIGHPMAIKNLMLMVEQKKRESPFANQWHVDFSKILGYPPLPFLGLSGACT